MIPHIDQVVDMSVVRAFRQETVIPGIVKYIEHRDNNEVDVQPTSIISLNISGRFETGGHAPGQLKYNPNQATKYNLSLGKKQTLNELERKIVLSMKCGEAAWVCLEPGQCSQTIPKPVFFRYIIKAVEEPKISFSNLSLPEKYAVINKEKDEADYEFTVNKDRKKAKEGYISAINLLKQISTKQLDSFTEEQTFAHRDLGARITSNLLSTLYFTKCFDEAKEHMAYAYTHLDGASNYKLMIKYFDIAKTIGDKIEVKEVLKNLLLLENDEALKAKYKIEVEDLLYNNKRMNSAFAKCLREADDIENREKTYNKIKDSINISYDVKPDIVDPIIVDSEDQSIVTVDV